MTHIEGWCLKKDVDRLNDIRSVDFVVVGCMMVVVGFHGAKVPHQVPMGYLELVYQATSLKKRGGVMKCS